MCSIMEMTLNYAYVIKTVIFVLHIILELIPIHWRLVKTFLNHKGTAVGYVEVQSALAAN